MSKMAKKDKRELNNRLITIIETFKKEGRVTTIINDTQMTFQRINENYLGKTIFLSMLKKTTIGAPYWSYTSFTPKEMVKFLQKEFENE